MIDNLLILILLLLILRPVTLDRHVRPTLDSLASKLIIFCAFVVDFFFFWNIVLDLRRNQNLK